MIFVREEAELRGWKEKTCENNGSTFIMIHYAVIKKNVPNDEFDNRFSIIKIVALRIE